MCELTTRSAFNDPVSHETSLLIKGLDYVVKAAGLQLHSLSEENIHSKHFEAKTQPRLIFLTEICV
jgi:hypothetical protein